MQLDALATLRHLNIRKEGDEKVLAYDLKIEVETSSHVLIEFHPSLPWLLWADSEPRFKGLITSVRLSGELRHHCARVASIEIADCTLKSFEVMPHAMNIATLTFTLTANPISGNTIALLSEFVQDKVSLHLSRDGDLFAPPAPDVPTEKPAKKKRPGGNRRAKVPVSGEVGPGDSTRPETVTKTLDEWPFPTDKASA